ncbi:MAG: flagellar basal body rod protein FlgC [Gammaproteobacteria bacterium]|nr:flagellar basal body rod protein FlgC [Gammaproteobacteria bacterium]MDH5652964.1 flagellar basal body rod protein FlgC [Gammaproteobacteria bacterium]
MSLFNVFDVSGTALHAQTLRLNTTASNMANANTASSSIDKTYRARHPVFAPMLDAFDEPQTGVGVQVLGIVESNAPLKKEFNPNHPLADKEGYINLPNVNVAEEMANMISASRSYQSNIEIMNSAKQMLLRTISLGQ